MSQAFEQTCPDGHPVPNGDLYCGRCGQGAIPAPTTVEAPLLESPATERQTSGRKLVLAALVIAVVAGLGGWMLARSNGDSGADDIGAVQPDTNGATNANCSVDTFAWVDDILNGVTSEAAMQQALGYGPASAAVADAVNFAQQTLRTTPDPDEAFEVISPYVNQLCAEMGASYDGFHPG